MAPRKLYTKLLAATALAALSTVMFAGCAATSTPTDSEELTGAPELASGGSAISGTIPVGTTLKATTGVNLRTGPGTSYSILHVVPQGATVTVEDATPQNGFYKVKHNGTVGWSFGQYYEKVADPAPQPQPQPNGSARDNAIARAKEGVGFSYWWGHGRWRPEGPTASTKGTCSGSCPSCSHGGNYGADCSGYVGKIWEVPASNSDVTVDAHPYSTASFVNDTSQWHSVARGSLEQADAMVYNSNGAGHVFLYSSGDGWGSMYAYECKGCAYGCVYDLRTASSAYHGIRHAGW